ncbi:MAG: SH3 domain-containing protein [Clostridia bacterium]|nr:SH3 domain-containing protein [Clostridia bacterium]
MRKLMIMVMLAWILTSAVMADAETLFVCCVHKGEWVWVREAPSHEAEKIDTIRYGVECQVSEIVDQFAHIRYRDNREGWADVSYLEMPIKETVYTITTEGPVNKRETPDGRYLGRVKGGGTRISVLGWRYSPSGELWAKVFRGGYIKAEYLQIAEANQ